MLKTDYGQMLADIHNQITASIKKVTPELAKNINMIAVELDGNVETAIKGDLLEIFITTAKRHEKEKLQLIINKYIAEIDYQQAWLDEKYQSHFCSVTTKSGIQILARSWPMEEKHAA